jgi:excinuclease ABC subunit C
MKSQYLTKQKLPDHPGVYFFRRGSEILYIGKATSLRDRTKSYFAKDLIATRGPLILDMVTQATAITWQETDSVLEALILEAELIKKHQPRYNTREKDNKSWNYVCITREELPQVLVVRGRNVLQKIQDVGYQATYGPFTNGMQLRDAMKIIRRIFPYIDAQSSKKDNFEFYRQLGLVPGGIFSPPAKGECPIETDWGEGVGVPLRPTDTSPWQGRKNAAALEQYKKNIANLKLFFEGKKKRIVSSLKKDMMTFAKKKEFEKAQEIKKRIFALEHINDVALIKDDRDTSSANHGAGKFRIEAYDVAHMSGKNMVGVMTVVEDGTTAKGEYKKFIIRTQTGSNDTGALEEILSRRFRHTEWGVPSLVVVDGSTAQLNVAKRVLDRYQFEIPIVAVVKDDRHRARALIGNDDLIKIHKKSIILANSEAHRFSIAFHKQKRNKNFLT